MNVSQSAYSLDSGIDSFAQNTDTREYDDSGSSSDDEDISQSKDETDLTLEEGISMFFSQIQGIMLKRCLHHYR